MGSGGPNRRTVLRRMATGSAALGLSGGVAARSDRTQRERRNRRSDKRVDRAELEADAIVRQPGADVREAVGPMWWLLTVDRDRLDELLRETPTDARLRTYTDALADLRAIYEVELSEERPDWYEYHLVDGDVDPLARRSESLLSTAGKVASLARRGLRQESDHTFQPEYFNSGHQDMVEAAFEYFDLWSWEKEDLKEGVIEPDNHSVTPGEKCFNCSDEWFNFELWNPFWDSVSTDDLSAEQLRIIERVEQGDFSVLDIPGKGTLEDWLIEQITDINDSAAPHHMYLDEEIELGPIPIAGLLWVVEVSGAAHIEAQYHVDEADRSWGVYERELGRALHYLQDCSLPMHAGAVIEQTGLTDIDWEFPLPDPNSKGAEHSAHEYYVQNNWESDEADDVFGWFKLYFDSYDDRAKWEGSAEETVIEMATTAGQYADQVLEEIIAKGIDNKDDWEYSVVESPTKLCVDDAGKYTRGMMDQLLDSETDLNYPPY